MKQDLPRTGPRVESRDSGVGCKLCGNTAGVWKIHYPEFVFRSGEFEAPPWFAHDKYFCPSCRFLWSDVFDAMDAATYGRKYVECNYEHQRRPTESRMVFAPLLLARLIRLTGGRRFLDYGCGYNYTYLYELRSRGFDLWGCDISAAVNYSRYLRRLPGEDFPDAFFDGVYSIDVMEHLKDFEADIRNIARVVKPGGCLLFNTISLDNYLKGDGGAPDDPLVWTPWHCSVFSEKSAGVLAAKLGLEFQGVIRTPSDTGLAFLFRKPGPEPASRLNVVATGWRLAKLYAYLRYFRREYLRAPAVR